MKIATCKLRAADEFRAKGDVRNYLNGIRINKSFIEATNGHVAIRMNSEIKTRMDIIVRFIGKIPKSACMTELKFQKNRNIAYHYDGFKQLISVQIFNIEDGRFPDFNKVIPKESEYKIGKHFPLLNTQYLALAYKAFGSSKFKFSGLKPVSYDKNERVVFKVTGLDHSDPGYGDPTIVIMPMKED